jgi:hypothetical protein
MVPNVFKRDSGWSYVLKQPQTEEEVSLCMEVVEGCPLSAVHADGDEFDYHAFPSIVDRDAILK